VLKGNLKKSIAGINEALLTTLGGCGDVNRNVMCCPNRNRCLPRTGRSLDHLDRRRVDPADGRVHEIWLDGEVVRSSEPEIEPVYGEQYLPRKFKTTVALEGDNCVDIYAHDLALVAMRERMAR